MVWLIRHRTAVWAVAVLAMLQVRSGTAGDYGVFAHAATLLRHDFLSVYDVDPSVQVGPPALLAGALITAASHLRAALQAATALVGLAAVWLIDRGRCDRGEARADARATLAGLVAVVMLSYVAASSHVDDALVLLGVAAGVIAVGRNRATFAGLGVGFAIAAKPWATVAAPMVLGLSRRRRLALLVAAGVVAASWIPFVALHPGTVAALGSFHLAVSRASALHGLGVPAGTVLAWLRPVQLLLATGAATWVLYRRGWVAAPLTGFAVRLLLDPGGPAYYLGAVALGALLLDLRGRRGRLPWWTLLTLVGLYLPAGLTAEPQLIDWVARLRALVCVVIVLRLILPATVRVRGAQIWAFVLQWRYVWLGAWAAAWFAPAYARTAGKFTDWMFFQAGALSIDNYSRHLSGGLHVYVVDPAVQIGPTILLPLAGLLRLLPASTVALLAALVMAGSALPVVRLVELAALRTGRDRQRVATVTLLAGAVLVAAWANAAGLWRHLDDAVALVCVALAAYALRKPGRGLLPAACLGLAAATKPWAVVYAPLLLALPRHLRARAALWLLASAAVWWLPFVLADPHTISALGGYHVIPQPGSVLYLFGLHADPAGWLRVVQLSAGACAAAWAVRNGDLALGLLAAVAVRVAFDPFAWSYYGLAPLLAALLLDAERRWATWTAMTATVFYLLPDTASASVAATSRLIWVVSALSFVVAPKKLFRALKPQHLVGRYCQGHRAARQS